MKINNTIAVLLILAIFTTNCKEAISKEIKEEYIVIKEKYRPNYHFTPKANWMNDPNGMFYLNGKYHLYFQYYPEDIVWGPMHWGHAISEDMITWEEQSIALYPDSLGYIFSGSAVVDHTNRSGLGKNGEPPVISMFTYRNIDRERAEAPDYESQAIAVSYDEGLTWDKYKENPVVLNPGGLKDFRDPKVYFDAERSQWIMVLAAYDETMFYGSKNLIDWEYLSSFGKEIGAHTGVWECPDFFQMKVEGSNEMKWVLLQSLNPGAPNGGSGTQYFIGDFDGKTFTLDASFSKALKVEESKWIDYGRDNYAGVTWSNIPKEDGRVLFIGWMSNWEYAQVVPTKLWRSAMTIARELSLIKEDGAYNLVSNPVKELDAYLEQVSDKKVEKGITSSVIATSMEVDLAKAHIELKLENLSEDRYVFQVSNVAGNILEFGIDNVEKQYFINRQKSGQIDFEDRFADKISTANFKELKTELKVKILLDEMSIEIFFDDGKTVMTEIFFPNEPFDQINLSSKKSEFDLADVIIKEFQLK